MRRSRRGQNIGRLARLRGWLWVDSAGWWCRDRSTCNRQLVAWPYDRDLTGQLLTASAHTEWHRKTGAVAGRL
ncbi:hypothetical protein AB0B66_10120 [Catellatospora sp. NPDC049111]|uniref:hypothetical protein n=1 Tax=Catellatospora sp. NPDC049111 TaxID=3155271 RepID=UPI0034074F61